MTAPANRGDTRAVSIGEVAEPRGEGLGDTGGYEVWRVIYRGSPTGLYHVTIPAVVQAGDLLLLMGHSRIGPDPISPAGWVLQHIEHLAAEQTFRYWTRVADPRDALNAFTIDFQAQAYAEFSVWRPLVGGISIGDPN